MPGDVTYADIGALVISILALVVSVFVAYSSLVSSFRPEILHDHRIFIIKLNGKFYIILKIAICNYGANGGTIGNLFLYVKDANSPYGFIPAYSRDSLGLTELHNFNSIMLKGRGVQEKFIFFTPSNNFSPCPGKMQLTLHYSINSVMKLKKVKDEPIYDLSDSHITSWNGGQIGVIESDDLAASRLLVKHN